MWALSIQLSYTKHAHAISRVNDAVCANIWNILFSVCFLGMYENVRTRGSWKRTRAQWLMSSGPRKKILATFFENLCTYACTLSARICGLLFHITDVRCVSIMLCTGQMRSENVCTRKYFLFFTRNINTNHTRSCESRHAQTSFTSMSARIQVYSKFNIDTSYKIHLYENFRCEGVRVWQRGSIYTFNVPMM